MLFAVADAAAQIDPRTILPTFALVLCAAAVTTVIFQYLKQPVVLGYMLAGLVIGPNTPQINLVADEHLVHKMADLGVILLMFSLGIEFSLPKLLRVGPTAGVVALVQCSLMIWLGFLVGQYYGWTNVESFFAGAVIAVSSTTIIIKAFEEQNIKSDFTKLVFGILIVEDLISILLITLLTGLSNGGEVGGAQLAGTIGRLALFLVVLMVVGLLIVPRLMRAVVRLNRPETTVVASIGLAFGFAISAQYFEYSVALGAFLAGSLVAESGVEKTIEHLVQPVRDIFGAIFFVSVGMLIKPDEIIEYWPLVLVFTAVVVFGKIISVTITSFLTGQSVQNSVKTGMSLAQIGEFSFIIAAVAVNLPKGKLLYSIAIAVSAITTLLTPWLIRFARPTASFIDRKLPRSLQTFVALYGTWLEQLKTSKASERKLRIRRLIRWLAVDAVIVAVIVIGASTQRRFLGEHIQEFLGGTETGVNLLIVAAAVVIASPFWIGMIRVARQLGFQLALMALPEGERERLDTAAAPRRLLIVTMQLAIVLVVGFPLVAVTQPFLPPFWGALILVLILVALAVAFWRGATNLQGHTRAAAQVLAEMLALSTSRGKAAGTHAPAENVNRILDGLGTPTPIRLERNSPAVGQTLAELNLRGLTGATILAIRRGEDSVVVPSGDEMLQAEDILAVAGTHDAIEAAEVMLNVRIFGIAEKA
ncbi:MAG: cation:proton antiporter [Pirellulales bacterium]